MRIERLHLLRYGAFTDREIVFRPNARLHIVYGPNEAGKSTTLSALSDLLFGFGHSVSKAFLHEASALRIGATLSANDGSELSFLRRRGRTKTLLRIEESGKESALLDDALAAFVGGLTKPVFEHAFGLDSHRLREGAEAMLASEGELGGTLLAAASGLTGLRDLRDTFDEEAGELYAPRASTKEFNALKSRYDEARQRARDSELKASDWKALNDEIDQLKRRHAEEKDRLASLIRHRNDLDRLKSLAPVIEDIDRDLRKLEAFSSLADLPAGFGDTLADASAKRAETGTALGEAQLSVQSAEEALDDIQVDEAVLAHAKAISALHARLGDYQEKRSQTPRIDSERRSLVRDIEDRTRRLGLTADQARERRPTDAELILAHDLAMTGEDIDRTKRSLEERLDRERKNETTLDRDTPSGHLADPKPHRERLTALKGDIEAVSKRDELERQHRTEKRRIREEALQLVPPVSDFDRFVGVALPPIDAVEAISLRIDDCERRHTKTHDALLRVVAEIEKNRQVLRETERAGEIPSREAIEAARQERDHVFDPLAAILRSEDELPSASEAGKRVAAFRAAVVTADGLADSALADSERVQRHADLSRRNAVLTEERTRLEKAAKAEEEERSQLQSIFTAPFERLSVNAFKPAAMIVWLKAMRQLLDAHGKNTAVEDELRVLEHREETLRASLSSVAKQLWIDEPDTLPTQSLLRAIEGKIEEANEVWNASREQAGRKRDAERRIAELEADRTALADRQTRWRAKADEAFLKIGLNAGPTPAEAKATITLWRELPSLERERVNRDDRVRGMERDTARFEADALALVSLVAPALAELPSERMVEELVEASEIAYRESAKLNERKSNLDRAKRVLDQRDVASKSAGDQLAALLERCPTGSDPRQLVERLKERDELTGSVERCRSRLVDIAPNWSEQKVRGALVEFDPSRADLDIEDLEREAQDLSVQSQETFHALRDKEKERERLSFGEGAEAAVFEQRAVEAEMLDLARRWAVLKIASNLVSATLEKHRQSQDAPLMRRAGERLKRLTDGSFAALSQQFNEKDMAELIAVRENGDRLTIADLSDGTRDQLFLALRLAFIEDYATRNEPIPFIGDDIFQTFDDVRTAAGLRTLADASSHMQPILFAHHRSVVDIAKAELGDDVDIIEIER